MMAQPCVSVQKLAAVPRRSNQYVVEMVSPTLMIASERWLVASKRKLFLLLIKEDVVCMDLAGQIFVLELSFFYY